MKILSIEPTPSPNSMKLNLSEQVPNDLRKTYTKEDIGQCPSYIANILAIDGVKNVFHTADFIAVERHPKADWQDILSRVREAFGEGDEPPSDGSGNGSGEAPAKAADKPSASTADEPAVEVDDAYGEAHVLIQFFRNIPLQVRVQAGGEEARLAMPERFIQAMMQAQSSAANMIMERRLQEQGIRYGDLKEIAEQVVQETDAAYSDERLAELVKLAFEQGSNPDPIEERKTFNPADAERILHDPNWKNRYAALDQLKPTIDNLPIIIKALEDENFSIRRLATVYLGDIKEPEVLPYLYHALEDKTPSVRRTAGDCLSDIGDPDAIQPMAKALKDPSKIVRWRAARFLYEAGDSSAVPALREALDDPEFEVRMQANIALERIEGGAAAEGSVWQQMTRRNER